MSRRRKSGRIKRAKHAKSRYKYLGRRIKDKGKKGLDRPSEFLGIARAIVRDRKAGKISKATARGRLALLLRLTNPSKNSKVRNWSARTRARVRNVIKKMFAKV